MEIGQLVRDVGVPVAILAFILWAGAKEWWVYGATHRRVVQECELTSKRLIAERDEWRGIALKGLMEASDAVRTSEKAALLVKASREADS